MIEFGAGAYIKNLVGLDDLVEEIMWRLPHETIVSGMPTDW
jgi:hypothetical protein